MDNFKPINMPVNKILLFLLASFLLKYELLFSQAQLLKDIQPGNASGVDGTFAEHHSFRTSDLIYFTAWDGVDKFDLDALWQTDGTTEGTQFISDEFTSNVSGTFSFLGEINDVAFFQNRQLNSPFIDAVWRIDRNPVGITRISPDNTSYGVNGKAIVFKDHLYLVLAKSGIGDEIWKSDGSPAGTTLLKDIHPVGNLGSEVNNFTVFNDRLLFTAVDDTSSGIWQTDGTALGTYPIKRTHRFVGYFKIFPPLDSLVLFSSFTDLSPAGNVGHELWRTDGTAEGTFVIKDINPGFSDSDALFGFRINDRVLVVADDGVHGKELWTSDGTTEGTQLLLDIYPGPENSNVKYIGTLNNLAFFTAKDGIYAKTGSGELWVTDGTTTGTRLLKDILPGEESGVLSNISHFASYQNFAFFSSASGTSGNYELWITDGTEEGTQLFLELYPGDTGSTPSNFQVFQDKLFFAATTPQYGRELWSYDLSTLSSHEYYALTGISLFPTLSADGTVNLATESPDWSLVDISVMDRSGRTVFTQADQTLPTTFSFNQLTPGTYFMQLVDRKNRRFTVKTFSVLRP